MDSYYFLHTRSLCGVDYNTYKAGLMRLNSLTGEMLDGEKRIKNVAVYENPLYGKLCEDYAETDVILKFIEQCGSVNHDIENDVMFNAAYPKKDVGFLGIRFTGIAGIEDYRKVVDSATLGNSRSKFLDRLIKYGDDRDLPSVLKLRYPRFEFSNDALDDLLWWKRNIIDIVDTVIKLLDDIPVHPFTGGYGKTEVLSYSTNQVASKRITQEDRLTYTYGEMTKIHRCKEHY